MPTADYARALRFARACRRHLGETPEDAGRCTEAHYAGNKWTCCERDGPYVAQVKGWAAGRPGRSARTWAVRLRQRKDFCEAYCLTHARREMRRRNVQDAA